MRRVEEGGAADYFGNYGTRCVVLGFHGLSMLMELLAGLRVVWLLARVISRNVLKISHLMVDVCDKSEM